MFCLWRRFPNRLGDDKTHEQSTSDESSKLKCPTISFIVSKSSRLRQNSIIAAKCSKPEIGRVFDGVYDTNHITSAPFYAHLIYVKCPFLLRNPQNTSLLRHSVIYYVIS